MSTSCLICNRIAAIRRGENLYFVRELSSGYVVLADHHYYRGYTLLLARQHAMELHELSPDARRAFLWEMSIVAEAVYRAFTPRKLNYELLGNTDHHLHWHLIPRHANDPKPHRAIWVIDESIRRAEATKPNATSLAEMKMKLNHILDQLITSAPPIR